MNILFKSSIKNEMGNENEQHVVSRTMYTHKISVGKHFQQKEKWICISLTGILIQILTLKFLNLVYLK